ncbi:MAG: MFS transporter [Bacteroidales bacterium]|nr:MFS transporter [Bacteroidales bacterium]
MKNQKSLVTLAMGTFGLGITEFMMMGILPYLAKDFSIDIPTAGHFISAYALGVCVGAPAVALGLRNWPLKRILYLLMSIFSVASICMTICPSSSYQLMMTFRFMAGLPHGAYFGVGCIVADKLADKEKSALAIAIMCMGMTIANLIGIPLGTFIADTLSWRIIFAASGTLGLVTWFCIYKNIPYIDSLPDNGRKGQFNFLKHLAPWLIIFATFFGNGGMMCWYSYVSPILTEVSGIPLKWMSAMMALAGIGMVAGGVVGGRLSDKIGAGHAGRWFQILMLIALTGEFFLGQYPVVAVILMMVATFGLFGVGAPQQLLLIRYASGGELLGGAMIQIAFNFGNAMGAYCGGLPIKAGYSYEYTALVACASMLVGLCCYTIFCRRYEAKK